MKVFFICMVFASFSALGFEDTVYRMSEEKEGHKVFFRELHGVYHLRKDIPNHEKILKTLKQSLSQNQAVKFEADTEIFEIKSVLCK